MRMSDLLVNSGQLGCAPCLRPNWRRPASSLTDPCSWQPDNQKVKTQKYFWVFYLYNLNNYSSSFKTRSLASSSFAMSSSVNFQPSAPAFCKACASFFAPGIGNAPLQITQFNATWAFD